MSTSSNGGASISAWPKTIAALTLFMEDLPEARRFYQQVFGLRLVFETASFADPGGHVWEVGHDLDRQRGS